MRKESKLLEERKHRTAEQKALNQAFIVTLVWTGFTIFFLRPTGLLHISLLELTELILFPTLGYFTKRGNKNAVIFLLILFIFDRIVWLINNGSHYTNMLRFVFLYLLA